MTILLTGATGYVGGRLLKKLESHHYVVRCLARHPEYLKNKIVSSTELFQGDLLDENSLEKAMVGVEIAYYLVHSMGTKGVFEEEEKRSASNFALAARKAGIKKIIYLGGIGRGQRLSPHLKSRQQVGDVLRESGIVVVEFQASIIIGSGSLSFEMIRSLMERLPIMTTPKWVNVLAQPIAIEDVIEYLIEALQIPMSKSEIFEIGGPDKVSYLDLMKEYGRQRGLKRLIIPVPVLSPRLSSLWLGLITPIYARVGRKLIESIRHETTVHNNNASQVFSVRPMPIQEAIRRAFKNEESEFAATRWSDAASLGTKQNWGGVRFGNRLIDTRRCEVPVLCGKAFAVIQRIGGKNGWYFVDWLWKFRGFLDLLIGGVGMKRGRKDPEKLDIGDVVDCWRVEQYVPNQSLRLVAEMKLPGRAWLDFEVSATQNGCCITQTAMYDPVGLLGLAYWYLIWPFHQLVFSGM
ncbi:MAG: SDR family oxidoreductase, partial [Candidatus Omnitrophica bacterium]|nr:SDR family oxidoreductase [Candidatus Omnitrophota bacterium]